MMDLSLKEFVQMAITVAGSAFAAYAAIKADLAKHTADIAALNRDVTRIDTDIRDMRL